MAHAAMRFGHSTINGMFRVEPDNERASVENLRNRFSDSDFVYENGESLIPITDWMIIGNFTE